MRYLAVLLLFVAQIAVSQTKSERILQFASDHLGERVGNGNCDELLIYAYKAACGCELRKRAGINKYRYYYGTQISRDSIHPGDIVQIDYFNKSNGKYVNGHVGIIYTVAIGNFTIFNQNVGVSRKRNGFVVMSDYDEILDVRDDLMINITYYHPS